MKPDKSIPQKLSFTKTSLVRMILILLIFSFTVVVNLNGEVSDEEASQYLKAHYTKKEYQIPMRDGVKLHTAVYSPVDTSAKYPVLMRRTPYSAAPYGEKEFPSSKIVAWHHLAKEGFILVFQDVRGKFMSEGDYVNMRPQIPNKKKKTDIDESSDTYDTVEWLIKHVANHNGKVGMWGISYPGFYAAIGTIDAHPALKAISPQAPIADWFIGDDWHHNGAFSVAHCLPFISAFGKPREGLFQKWPKGLDIPTPDGYKFYLEAGPLKNIDAKYLKGGIPFWNYVMEHGTYDEFWKARSTLPHFKNVKPAVLTVGGWFDAENCFGAINTYHAIEKLSPKADSRLVLGPWFHGGWVRSDGSKLGDVSFGSKTGDYYEENIELPFFRYYLKGSGPLNLPEASVFETGSNTWKTFDQWPPANVRQRKIYFGANQSITLSPPKEDGELFAKYISDPARPVPYVNEIIVRIPRRYMVADQRFSATRPDVLVFESPVLKKDVTIAGPVIADLYVSTTGADSDWVVKVIDVFPDQIEDEDQKHMEGYQMMLRGDIMRGKFRNSLEKPEPMVPDKITQIKFSMNDLCHTFKKGHKMMIQVQSSWFPLFDRNPQTFVDIYNAEESDFREAQQRVYFSKQYPSGIIFHEIEGN